ncbi:protein kinase C [Saccharomycopsis crataegensis]|uniref:protein kinase C n=1 Tax=Saccharomycopsis crataegensis TaxID=43959 RepID=A0AAV5QDD0_9ASCO|nr:protein kinase C [Saccharomycopsis crataegensis]
MSDAKVINDIKKKIEREQNIINSTTKIKESTNNVAVKEKCNSSIREATQNLEYLRKTLEELSLRSVSSKDSDSSSQTLVNSQNNHKHNPPNFTGLDLIKYDCPSLGHRIQYMVHLMEFKLQIENQYKEASEKMLKLYQSDADKVSSTAALGGRIESNKKIPLLTRSLKRYRDMHIDILDVKEETDLLNDQRARGKPPTGIITIGISSLKDIDHIVTNSIIGKKSESIILIKVDDELKVRTKPFKNGKLQESLQFQINVAKNNEIELSVCDRVGDQLIPVAIVWFMIADIVEELRRKRKQYENHNNGWVSASNMPTQHPNPQTSNFGGGFNAHQSPLINDSSNHPRGGNGHDSPIYSANTSAAAVPNDITSTARYILEPNGQILLTFGFVKTDQITGNRIQNNNLDGLGRHGAIREKKEATFEQHGHHFVQKNTYNIMMCAYCGDFARYSCYQCQDCRYLCHKKCYKNVVTKCISKASNEVDPDEAKLNHKIPHRFEPVSNRGTKWCCHCGYILPWGKKNVRKCSECGIMCHSGCAHLVPDFCGMSMIMANKILETIKHSGSKTNSPVKSNFRSPQMSQQQMIHQHAVSGFGAQGGPQQSLVSQEPDHSLSKDTYGEPQQHNRFSYMAPQPDSHNNQQTPSLKSGGRYSEDTTVSSGSRPIPEIKIDSDFDKRSDFGAQSYPYHDPTTNYAESGSLNDMANPFDQDHYGTDLTHEVSNDAFENQYQQQSPMDVKKDQYYDNYGTENMDHRISQIESGNNFIEERPSDEFSSNLYNDSRVEPLVLEKRQSQLPYPIDDMEDKIPDEPEDIVIPKPKKEKSRRRKVGLDDFQFLAVLGKGNFGKVMLAESRHTKKLCAIKVLKKDFILENDEVESTKSEKRVFLIANKKRHPFLINLHCCFQTANRIYFVMEYISGGDLMWHIQKARFSQRRAQFYAAEVLLGLKYFHDNGVIYRDLKLDNILLTTEGHIKIADYGLCKEEMWFGNTTSTFCGTPEFMAPEILKEQKYGKAVDWWAFGVLLYQMLLGQSPFRGRDEEEIFNAILTDDPLYPIQMARESVEILQALLTRDPSQRLGFSPRDAEEVMEHPYFRNINFDDILSLRIDPPYLPEVKSEHDVSNFDDEFTAETPRLTPVNSTLDSSMQEKFRGFSHMSSEFAI